MNDVALPEHQLRELALFAGAGGGILGGHLLGWRCVCAVEYAAYPRKVLLARQRDGMLPKFPIWDDVRTFDGKPWRGHVDVISGGFPCQDISTAGKGRGIEGERSGLWKEMARIIGEVRPRFVLVENSPALTSRGLGTVLGDLATLGYNAEWGVFNALDTGALHQRERIWILAYPNEDGDALFIGEWISRNTPIRSVTSGIPRPLATVKYKGWRGPAVEAPGMAAWAEAEPELDRMANGLAHQVDRIACVGNGQIPAVVRLAWTTLYERIQQRSK